MKLILPVSFLLVLLLNPAALLAVDQMEQGVPGFWGEMQFSYHFLQPLDKAVERMGIDSIQTRWIFP